MFGFRYQADEVFRDTREQILSLFWSIQDCKCGTTEEFVEILKHDFCVSAVVGPSVLCCQWFGAGGGFGLAL